MGGNLGAAVQMLKVINQQGGGQSWEQKYKPTDLTATVISATQIDLTWNETCPDEDGFIIERSTDGITYSVLDYVLSNVECYSDQSCIAGETYYYRVRAFKLDGVNEREVDLLEIRLATELETAQITKLNTLVSALKTGLSITYLSDYFDFLDIFGNQTSESSLFNIVKNQHHPILGAASPTFTAYEGWQGNGSTQYIDLNFNPATEGVNYTLNNGAIGIYSRTDSNGAEADIGCRDAGNIDVLLIARTSGNAYGRINNTSISQITGANTNAQGLYIATRNGALAGNLYLYKNKTSIGTSNADSVSIPSINLWALGRNGNGTLAAPSTRQLSLVFASRHVSTAHRDIIVDAFEAYMDSNGKGVI